jgi:hypothetical protein
VTKTRRIRFPDMRKEGRVSKKGLAFPKKSLVFLMLPTPVTSSPLCPSPPRRTPPEPPIAALDQSRGRLMPLYSREYTARRLVAVEHTHRSFFFIASRNNLVSNHRFATGREPSVIPRMPACRRSLEAYPLPRAPSLAAPPPPHAPVGN